MEKFADKKTFIDHCDMANEDEDKKGIEVTITNDCFEIADPEEDGVKVSWFSPAWCKTFAEYFDEYPSDDEIAALIKKSEHADWVEVVD